LLNYNSLTPFGAQVLQGTADLNELPILQHTKLLLQHQKTWLLKDHQQFHQLSYAAMLDGFWKWPKCTSTSPSGCHLGIYKSLTKDANWKDKKCTQAQPEQQPQAK